MGVAPLAMVAAVLPGACTLTRPIPADVRVPPELLRGSGYTSGGEPLRSRYVVRMTDGQRDWEIQLPEIATAYEVKVPLSGKPSPRLAVDSATMTAADREILQDREAAARAESGELDRQYPDDEHILSMKGSLYERLGNKNLAREAWQQTLRINPYNLAVLEALQRLGK